MLLARGESHCASTVPSPVRLSQQPRSHATSSIRGARPTWTNVAISARITRRNATTSAADDHHDCDEARDHSGDLKGTESLVQDHAREEDGAGGVERRECDDDAQG